MVTRSANWLSLVISSRPDVSRIEPAYRRQERAGIRNQVVDRRPSLRVLVGRQITRRLVKQQVDALASHERLAVEEHAIPLLSIH